jgi:hypothetical protein
MVEDLIKRLRDDAGFDGQKLLAANALEQQAARLTALESERDALLNSLAAARQDASTAWERHAMATRIGNAAAGDLATARGRIVELEAERDALLAAAGKEAVAAWKLVPMEPTPNMLSEIDLIEGFSREALTTRYKAMLDAAPTAAHENGDGRDAQTLREALQALSHMYSYAWDRTDGALVMFDIERFEAAHEKARTALSQKANDGLSLRAQHEDACIAANNNAQDAERYRWLRTLDSDFGNRNRMSEMARFYGETLDEAIDAALSQKANDSLSLRAQHEDACIEANKNAQDAERYRHLRQCNSGSLVIVQIIGTGDDEQIVLTEEDADAAIDVALSQKAGEQQ